MPTPRPNESKSSFISRCIEVVLKEGTAEDEEQAAAICYGMWDRRQRSLEVERGWLSCPSCGYIVTTRERSMLRVDPTCRGCREVPMSEFVPFAPREEE